jgi:hypothetical protein
LRHNQQDSGSGDLIKHRTLEHGGSYQGGMIT